MTGKKNGGRKPRPKSHETAPRTALEEKQALLAHHVRMVARGLTNGLFISGTGGCGKSKVIAETLAEECVNPVLLNSHVTPLSLYAALYEHRQGKVLWLDDADAMYTNLPILGLLRSALWGTAEGRVVTYSSTQLAGVPGSFAFESRVIFTANTIPKRNEAFKAVLSRVDVFELVATNDELLEQMDVLAQAGFGSLDAAACKAVVDYIRHAGGNRQLSMRLYESSLRKVEYAATTGTDWKDLVRSQLDQLGSKDRDGIPKPLDSKGHDLRCMSLAVEKFPASARQQEEFWCESTGKSRATFFRIKKQFESQQQEDDQ
ncbi:MAG: hypothetical protein K2V38_18445 [Gemmataceae bacterium]|nr:hypothetical protein [Gemmataceae bacterium]